jgi:prepilin-type N-terminal cleavage/methylation domain-containing protein
MRKLPTQRGFTLIELLVAITLASLAAVLGAAVLKAGVDYVGRAREYLRVQEDFHAATKTVRFLWQGRTPDNFIGFADLVEFSTRRVDAPSALLATRVRLTCRLGENERYTLHREFLADTKALEKARAAIEGSKKPAEASKPPPPPPASPPGAPAGTPPPPPAVPKIEWQVVGEEDLLGGLDACSFAYLRTLEDKDKKTASWQPAWIEGAAPRMLRLNISLQRGAVPPLLFTAG